MTKSTSWIDGEGDFQKDRNIDRVPHVTLAPRISGEDTFVISSRLGSGRACLILLYWLIYFETRFSGLCLGRRLVVLENKENTDHKQGRLEPCRHLPNRQGGRTKCQPDKMPTGQNANLGWHFVRDFFLWLAFCPDQLFGWHFVRTISTCLRTLRHHPWQPGIL